MTLRPRLASIVAEVRLIAAPTLADRAMDADIEALARTISEQGFPKESRWKRMKR
jgi:hypothetical protein